MYLAHISDIREIKYFNNFPSANLNYFTEGKFTFAEMSAISWMYGIFHAMLPIVLVKRMFVHIFKSSFQILNFEHFQQLLYFFPLAFHVCWLGCENPYSSESDSLKRAKAGFNCRPVDFVE